MAKGYDADKQRKELVSSFGKDLARRAKSKCELSGESGVPLIIYEMEPVKAEPDFNQCLFISQTSLAQIKNPKLLVPDQWRILGEQVWSELPQVQIMAVRMLTYIAKNEHWAQEILDNMYLDDSIMDIAQKHPLV
ncbi:MAG: phnA protein [Akkermansiaceae bacterium]